MRHCNKTVRNRSPTVVQTQQHPTLTVDIRPGVVQESYESRTGLNVAQNTPIPRST